MDSTMEIIKFFIEDDGSVTFLDSPYTRGLKLGPDVKRRYSSVEPDNAVLRLVFIVLCFLFADESAVAAWTRQWTCSWRAHIKNGPVLPIRSTIRQQVIDAEIAYFNENGVTI